LKARGVREKPGITNTHTHTHTHTPCIRLQADAGCGREACMSPTRESVRARERSARVRALQSDNEMGERVVLRGAQASQIGLWPARPGIGDLDRAQVQALVRK
jgi:hypothetical protein